MGWLRRGGVLAGACLAAAAAGWASGDSNSAHVGQSTGTITWQSWAGTGARVRWFTVHGDGTGYRELIGPPAWTGETVDVSPDGRLVVGSDRGGIWTSRTTGSAKRKIVRMTGTYSVKWSPSGTAIAFVKNRDQYGDVRQWKREIYVVRPDGTALRHLATAYGWRDADFVSWSKGSQRILYSSQRRFERRLIGANETIYAVDVSAGTRVSLGKGNCPSYSPDGRRIAFSIRPSRTAAHEELKTAETDGGHRRKLGVAWHSCPVWAPNSTELAGAGTWGDGLVTVRVDSGRRHKIAPLSGNIDWLEWEP